MIMKLTNPKPNIRLWLMGLILFVLPGFLLSCGDGSGSPSTDSASDTCALAFDIEWNRETRSDDTSSNRSGINKFELTDCGTEIETVGADVFNTGESHLQNGGPWQCSDHRGEIQNVPAGSPGFVTVYGMDGNDDILYWGRSAEIDLTPSEIVSTGTITANSFVPLLSIPADGATVTSASMQFQWQAVSGAVDYRIVVSASYDLSNPVVYAVTNGNTVYSPAGLQDGSYYWQMRAIDLIGNESAGSDTWGFTLAIEPNTAPTVEIESPNDEAVFQSGATVIFSGSASDDQDGPLTGNSLAWTSDVDGTMGTGSVFQISTLSLGAHTITLTATDSLGATGTASITVTIVEASTQDISGTWQFSAAQPWAEGDAGCTPGTTSSGICQITQTGNNFTLDFLSGWTCDPPFTCSYSGTVSNNHYVGYNGGVVDDEGGVVTSIIDFTAVSEDTLTGQSTSQYDLSGYQCRWGYDLGLSPSSVIDLPPVAAISSPSDGSTWGQDQSISFIGSGTDPEDGDLTGTSLIWTSSIDGQIHTGGSFYIDTLSVGTHLITLTAVDSQGNSDTETINIAINIAINIPPSVTISSPLTGDRFDPDTSITFTGSASDPEDGVIDGSALTWQSSIDGMLGTGNSITPTSLSYGQHTITLSTVDSQGTSGSAAINVNVNYAPYLDLYQPFNNSQSPPGSWVIFEAMTSDTEDGVLPAASIVWPSSIDGQVATGAYTGSSSLSYGIHTLTCTVTDSLGDSTTESVTVVINTAPVATITQPLPTMYFIGNTIDCQGSWFDAEDTFLLTSNLVWTYQEYSGGTPVGVETTIGTGNNQTVVFNDFATYRIRFRVTDNLGGTNTAYVDIDIGG